uniref:DRBM domain-containing protein n=2 Tax=Hordeum vulgare subsp. vulgare TaxID=112509 RepID=A0A8I7BE79_HORVV
MLKAHTCTSAIHPGTTKPSSLILQSGGAVGMDGAGMATPPEANTSPAPNGGGCGWIRVENCYVFKSRLQEYVQKAGLMTPEYQTLKEGPSHAPIFSSTVVINDVKYDSLPGFFSRKAAEQSAAEVALMEIGKSMALPTNATIPAVQETGLCKNLLQEYAQKMNYAIPSYICNKQSPYICTVEIGGIQYIGATARTKKEAEIKAARTALLAIQGQSEGCANGTTKYIVVPGKRQGKDTEKKPVETPKSLKTKKGGFKKQRNKNKFIKKNGQEVNEGKDETGVPGDAHHSDVPMKPAVTTEDPSANTVMMQPDEEAWSFEHEPASDTAMLQPDEDALPFEHEPSGNTAMLQPDGEATKVGQEHLSDTAMLQPDEDAWPFEHEPAGNTAMLQPDGEATKVGQEHLSDTAMLQPDDEGRRGKQEPLIGTAMPQPHMEDRRVGAEPPRDAAMVQPNDEARCVKQELLIDTAMPLPNEEAGAGANPVPPSDSTTAQPNAETTNINGESLRNAASAQHNEEARTLNQEPPSSASLLQPKEPRVENGEFVSENKDQTLGDASREANRSIEDMPEKSSNNSSAFTSAE